MKFPDSGGPKEVEIAAGMIRAAYVTDQNGFMGTGVHVRFEVLRDAIATALIEVGRLAREEELARIKTFLCGECRMGTAIDPDGGHHRLGTTGEMNYFDCAWKELGL